MEPLKIACTNLSLERSKGLLIQHGVIFDEIGEFQLFNEVVSLGDFEPTVKFDHLVFQLFNKAIGLKGPAVILPRQLKAKNNKDTIFLHSLPLHLKNSSKVLVFSSYHEPGMQVQTKMALFELLYFLDKFHFNRQITIVLRLHPDESVPCYETMPVYGKL